MSIQDPDMIDAIGTDNDNTIVLIISDHLPWDDEQHLKLLEEKLISYVTFANNGQLTEHYPDAKGKKVKIHIECHYDPDEIAARFFIASAELANDAGIALSYEVLTQA